MAVLPVSVALVTGLMLLSAIQGVISVSIYTQGETRLQDGSPDAQPSQPTAGQHLQTSRRRLHVGKARRVHPISFRATQTTVQPGPQAIRSENSRLGGLDTDPHTLSTEPTSLNRALRVLRQKRKVYFSSGSESLRHSLQTQACDYLEKLSAVYHDLVQQVFQEGNPHHNHLGDDKHLPNPQSENQGYEKHHPNPNYNNHNNQGDQQHPEQNPDQNQPSNTNQGVDDWNIAIGIDMIMNMSTETLHDLVLELKNVWSIVEGSKQLLRKMNADGDQSEKMHCLKQTLAQMTPAEQQHLLSVLGAMWQDILDKADHYTGTGTGTGTESPQKVDIADVCCMVG